jgi:pimeloyl-ACP methyl ester carboxylesterase
MNETIFDIEVKGDSIYGIWHQPIVRKNIAAVFLHGWAGHRPGPHDMLVKLARRITNNGYDCFRFDFRGKGYSQGDRRQTNNQSMLEDLDAVLQYVNNTLNYPAIVLIGICSGAKLALYYARNGSSQITHVIEMSSPVLRQHEAESKLASNKAKSTINEYLKKIFHRETWRKFVGGEIHFSAIGRNLLKPLYRLLKIKKKVSVSGKKIRYSSHNPDEKPFGKFQGQLLLIHGEKDPETELALQQIQVMLQQHNISSDTYVVKNANHSFYSLAWEKEIIQTVIHWLERRFIN